MLAAPRHARARGVQAFLLAAAVIVLLTRWDASQRAEDESTSPRLSPRERQRVMLLDERHATLDS